jgi:5-methyltetrahydrofolate--homocysteine methyltransferase
MDAGRILDTGMLPAMDIIGAQFADGTAFIPQVLLSARAMNQALALLEPHLEATGEKRTGTIVIGTVEGDLHDIGKNMVVSMLKGVGFKVVDLGVNVNAKRFVQSVAECDPDVLALSALLTTTMPQIRTVIGGLHEEGLRDSVKVMVGGAPVNQKFADDIGADGYANDAGAAVNLTKRLVEA